MQAWYYKYDFESRWVDIHKRLNISMKDLTHNKYYVIIPIDLA